MTELTLFLTQSKAGRWYYSAKEFITWTYTGADGSENQMLSPHSNRDVSKLPDDAITAVILPLDYNDHSEEEILEIFPKKMTIDYTTGLPV